jgi:uncharacterized DUF497 family protein
MAPKFEWDSTKAKSNFKKHGISFETAVHVFDDPLALIEQDRIEGGEYRWQALGLVEDHLVVMVAHTVHDDHNGIEVFRLISARPASSKERKRYGKNRAISV